MNTSDIIAIIVVVTIAIIIILIIYNYFVSSNELKFLEKEYQLCFSTATSLYASKVNSQTTTALNNAKNYYSTYCAPIASDIQKQNPLYDLATQAAKGIYNALTALGIGGAIGLSAPRVLKAIISAFQEYSRKAPTTVSSNAVTDLASISNEDIANQAFSNLENGVYKFYGSVAEYMSVLTGPVTAILKNALYITSDDVINQIASYVNANLALDIDEILLNFEAVLAENVEAVVVSAITAVAIAAVILVADTAGISLGSLFISIAIAVVSALSLV